MTNDERVLALLERLEADNRMLKRIGAAVLTLAGIVMLGAAVGWQDPKAKPRDPTAVQDLVRTRRLEIANSSGTVVAVLHANETEDDPGWLTDYYDTGRRKWRAEIEDNRYGGQFTSWWPNGLIQETGTYTNGRRHGLFTFYHDNGQPKARGAYSDGSRTGIWTSWHENGRKASEGLYEDDERIGDWREWHDNEQLKRTGKYVAGEWHGPVKEWSKSGPLLSEVQYEEGVLSGDIRRYFENGQVREEGQYDEYGKKTGTWRRYQIDGSVDPRGTRSYDKR